MPNGLQFTSTITNNSFAGVETDSGSIMKTSESQSDEDFDNDTIDVNQDLLYEPNQFNVLDTNNFQKPGHEDSISTSSKETQFDTILNNEEIRKDETKATSSTKYMICQTKN